MAPSVKGLELEDYKNHCGKWILEIKEKPGPLQISYLSRSSAWKTTI